MARAGLEYHVFCTLPARYTHSLRRAVKQQKTAGESQWGAAHLRTRVCTEVALLDDATVAALAGELGRAEQAVVAGALASVLEIQALLYSTPR